MRVAEFVVQKKKMETNFLGPKLDFFFNPKLICVYFFSYTIVDSLYVSIFYITSQSYLDDSPREIC